MKNWPNLNSCRRTNNWDEVEFIPNGTGAVMGARSLRPCRFRAFLSKSSLMGAQVNKLQSVLLPKMWGIVDCDSTRKAARKSQKLCICKSQPLFQTFTFYTLPHFWQEGKPYGMEKMPYLWLLSGGKTTPCGLDGMAMETVIKTRQNFDLVFDGQSWCVICHILENSLCDLLRAFPPHTCKHPFWLNLAAGWCESCSTTLLMCILQWSF